MESRINWKVIVIGLLWQPLLSFAGCVGEDKLRTGDLVFRYEDSLISKVVLAYQGDSNFSHVGMALRTDQGWKITHAEYDPSREIDGVISESYCSYIRLAQRGVIKRFNKPYGFDEMVFHRTLREHQFKKFNLRLKTDDIKSVYCTQYVWLVHKKIYGFDPFNLKKQPDEIIVVKDLYQSPYFSEIYRFNN